MARKNEFKMQFGILSGGKWTGKWLPACGERVASSLQQLRAPSHYWVISDAQLKRDLAGRTVKDIYRENRAKRGVEVGYVPRWETGDTYRAVSGGGIGQPVRSSTGKVLSLRAEYLEWCAARNHTPHPASIDGEHPKNCHRFKAPKAERISPAKDVLQLHVNRMIAGGSPVITELAA